jgi:glyoxylase-like metal-dependent hydrolase (beta-lactamase superfamily II)
MHEVADGILQLTLPLPLGLDHVHCYLLRRPTGGWMLVDTGLGSPDWEERWATVVEELDAPIERILITHFHPDHVGGAADVRNVTGAEVLQGAQDHAMMLEIWSNPDYSRRSYEAFRAHGVPEEIAFEIFRNMEQMKPSIRYVDDVTPLAPGDTVDGWQVLLFGGHADGHIALLRDGILVGGDNLLMEITPNIGYYVDGDTDPLGTYYETLAQIEALAPRLTLPGHGPVIVDSAGRARETGAHHDDRLALTLAALDPAEPRDGYQVSLSLWDFELSPIHRRFAVQEAVAHLERLVRDGRAARQALAAGAVAYTAA